MAGRVKDLFQWLIAAVAAGAIAAFLYDSSFQNSACRSIFLSRVCALVGLGNLPSVSEEADWKSALAHKDAESLRSYIRRFPEGAHVNEAVLFLQSCRKVEKEVWSTDVRQIPLYQPTDAKLFASTPAAKVNAMARASEQAQELCSAWPGADGKQLNPSIKVGKWHCEQNADGSLCSLDGFAECLIRRKLPVVSEICGHD